MEKIIKGDAGFPLDISAFSLVFANPGKFNKNKSKNDDFSYKVLCTLKLLYEYTYWYSNEKEIRYKYMQQEKKNIFNYS